jgi:hypothetical protein
MSCMFRSWGFSRTYELSWFNHHNNIQVSSSLRNILRVPSTSFFLGLSHLFQNFIVFELTLLTPLYGFLWHEFFKIERC